MMRTLIAITALVASIATIAQTQVPNVFEDGKPAKAAEVNANFDTLESAIDSNDEDFELFRANTWFLLPPSNCSTNQIIKWSGSAWVCATDVLAGLSCAEGQTIRYESGAWRCGCVAPGAPIDQDNLMAAIADWRANGDDSIYGPISQWCTGAVTNMSSIYTGGLPDSFNEDISGWDTSNVTDMSYMFFLKSAFNQNIGSWDVSNVKSMSNMFENASAFNQDLSNWDASSVMDCALFANRADAWNNAYGGSITGKTPPLSASLIAAGCRNR